MRIPQSPLTTQAPEAAPSTAQAQPAPIQATVQAQIQAQVGQGSPAIQAQRPELPAPASQRLLGGPVQAQLPPGAGGAVQRPVGVGVIGLREGETLAGKLERAVLEKMLAGFPAVSARIDEISSFMIVALLTPEASQLLELERSLLQAGLGGKQGFDGRIKELEELMLVALFSPAQHAQVQAELGALRRLSKNFALLEQRADELQDFMMRARFDEHGYAVANGELSALRHHHQGSAAILGRVAEIDQLLAGNPDEGLGRTLNVERAALQAVHGGSAGIRERLAEIHHTFLVARLLPDAFKALENEQTTLRNLLEVFAQVEARLDEL